MKDFFVGADISSKSIDICVIGQASVNDNEKKTVFERKIDNKLNGFRKIIKDLEKLNAKHGGDCTFYLAMEATGTYHMKFVKTLFDEASELVIPYVVNPLQIKATGEAIKAKNKTDKQDALKIASYIRMAYTQGNVYPWKPLPPEMEELKQLAHLYEDTRDLIRAEKNRIHAIEQSPSMSKPTAQIRLDHIKYLEEQLEDIKKRMEEYIQKHADIKKQAELLRTIPGIGKISSAMILCEIGDIRRYRDKKAFTVSSGLTPSDCQSGTSINKPAHITKKGSKRIRRCTYMPAMVALRWNPIIKEFYTRLRNKGKCGKSALIAAMKKLLEIIYGILTTEQPFNPNYEAERAA